jgi:hypothetical protein
MAELFNEWLTRTRMLQENVYGMDYSKYEGSDPDSINNLIEYMRWNKQRQLKGYNVKDVGVKCALCSRAIDDVGVGTSEELCAKCAPKEVN